MKRNTLIALLGFLAITGFFLLSEHRAHVLGILPYVLVLSCPLLHIVMHSGHGHRHETKRSKSLTKHDHDKQ